MKAIIVGIDASNLRGGGGITHLVELLNAIQPDVHGVKNIVVWGSSATLEMLEERPWLIKITSPVFDKSLLHRIIWQIFHLSKSARDANCDVLFVPGGSFSGRFKPVVTMSQNLLPFEMSELRRYGWTIFALKLLMLRLSQTRSFQKSDGVIFLTNYARDTVLRNTGYLYGTNSIVPHGLNTRFKQTPKPQCPITNFGETNPFRILYVSTIDQYKHQWVVVEAVATLRQQGFPIVLDLVGSAYKPALQRLNKAIDQFDKTMSWVCYHGEIPFETLHLQYAEADVVLFASSCENMPNILLEMMASGLPIACSNRGPMPEILGAGGVYFDPEVPESIASALRILIESPKLRSEIAQISYQRAQQYSWERCANETFKFLMRVARMKGERNV